MKIPESFLAAVRTAEAAFLEQCGGPPEYGFEPWALIEKDRSVIHPPFGFVPFPWLLDPGADDGNNVGYYWPIGREDRDPMVAQLWNDAGSLIPIASSRERFLKLEAWEEAKYRDGDKRDIFSPQVLAERATIDPDSPYLLTALADVAAAAGEDDRAEALYREALGRIPEYTDALIGLAILMRRLGRADEALGLMLEALRAPVTFWVDSYWAGNHFPPDRVNRKDYRRKFLHWIQCTTPSEAGEHARDPLYQARDRLTFASGVKTNDDYGIYDELIDAYIERDRPLASVGLAMLYGELMGAETISFRERYRFDEASQRGRLMKTLRAAGLSARTEWLADLP